MSPNAQPVQELPSGVADARLVEAARYALLRRLAPSMRHHLVVNLQPIGMIYEVMDRRLKVPQPDLAEVHESAHKINGFAKAALASCLDVVTWLAPLEEARTTVEDGVRECLALVATSLTFRGYNLRNDVAPVAGAVRRSSLRNVLTALLLYATDHTPATADLVLAAEGDERKLTLTLTIRPTEGEPSFTGEVGYRRLEWADLEALAGAESAELTREGRLLLRLSLPWLPPAQT
jgi:C4-dicarboxylate-specific signal transduction histidine kinase